MHTNVNDAGSTNLAVVNNFVQANTWVQAASNQDIRLK
jgi:hypothetical protein